MGFSRQEYWNGLLFPSPGDLSKTRDQTHFPCIGKWILHHWATEAQSTRDLILIVLVLSEWHSDWYRRKVMTNLDSVLKSRDIALPAKVHLVKALVFPVVKYGCESWTIEKTEHQKLMLFNCGVGEDFWESFGLQEDSLEKEIATHSSTLAWKIP